MLVMPWLGLHNSRMSPSHAAIAALGSIGLPTTRPLSCSSRTTCAAAANAACVATLSPKSVS